ncbi:MAG TPA: hypothetical protein VF045_11570, partial [Acidimicrobiales bacterium]
ADRSRCFLATQQQVVVGSILDAFPDEMTAHLENATDPVEPELIAELVDIRNGVAVLDERHRLKQPDWSYNKRDSGTVPVEKYAGAAPPWGV